MSGLQRLSLGKDAESLELYLKTGLKNPDKKIHFISSRLRSAGDIFKKGGHVTMVYSDQSYSLLYDNKRKITPEANMCAGSALMDSTPLKDITEALVYKNISKFASKSTYQTNLPQRTVKKYKSYIELGVRNFIKALFSNELNLDSNAFGSYSELITFINHSLDVKYRLTPAGVAMLNYRKNSRVLVPRTPELELFVVRVKSKFPSFDDKGFFIAEIGPKKT